MLRIFHFLILFILIATFSLFFFTDLSFVFFVSTLKEMNKLQGVLKFFFLNSFNFVSLPYQIYRHKKNVLNVRKRLFCIKFGVIFMYKTIEKVRNLLVWGFRIHNLQILLRFKALPNPK